MNNTLYNVYTTICVCGTTMKLKRKLEGEPIDDETQKKQLRITYKN